jgi:nitrate/TMAO reductase-like tetraheme cytochrome c subunit
MFVFGLVAVIGSEVMIYQTGTDKFCAGACHSMEAFTAPEWRDSIHYSNASGVQAGCSDCHIPHIYPQKLWVKATSGARDIYGEIRGVISTREKYEAHRLEMAELVWQRMKETDSRECRYCHNSETFDLESQNEYAARAHQQGLSQGETCIDCHKGIAHLTPDEAAPEFADTGTGEPR